MRIRNSRQTNGFGHAGVKGEGGAEAELPLAWKGNDVIAVFAVYDLIKFKTTWIEFFSQTHS